MLQILEAEKPDFIVVTGDTITAGNGAYDRAGDVLKRLKAPLGVYVVRGNWENRRRPENDREFYRAAGVTLLDNENVRITEKL